MSRMNLAALLIGLAIGLLTRSWLRDVSLVIVALTSAVAFLAAIILLQRESVDKRYLSDSVDFLGRLTPRDPEQKRIVESRRAIQQYERAARSDKIKKRQVAALMRDMVEGYEIKGLTRRAWASKRAPSGFWVSQALWKDAYDQLLKCRAVEIDGNGRARLVATPREVLVDLGLNSREEERQKKTLFRHSELQRARNIRRIQYTGQSPATVDA